MRKFFVTKIALLTKNLFSTLTASRWSLITPGHAHHLPAANWQWDRNASQLSIAAESRETPRAMGFLGLCFLSFCFFHSSCLLSISTFGTHKRRFVRPEKISELRLRHKPL